jgi:hypothetical protein
MSSTANNFLTQNQMTQLQYALLFPSKSQLNNTTTTAPTMQTTAENQIETDRLQKATGTFIQQLATPILEKFGLSILFTILMIMVYVHEKNK